MKTAQLEIRRGKTPASVVIAYRDVVFDNVQVGTTRNVAGRLTSEVVVTFDPEKKEKPRARNDIGETDIHSADSGQ